MVDWLTFETHFLYKYTVDKHILLFLELGVVLFKSSHYFTISNF